MARNAGSTGPRIRREQRTIAVMMRIYCCDHHGGRDALCASCSELHEYARRRLEICPFQDAKPACNRCEVHCYSAARRDRVKAVMGYAGPRMLLRHPWLSLWHLIDARRPVPRLDRR
ncbi:hypothetical protein ThidrDRAFT_1698 [Thiorhodococcus drewsii AZ1]|uniref:Nitrous oxide-stimulated promoter family protein n=1 Tax=Thiorhodococcus drewsii AZ1 TaxID=765913 RepID=G2E085_9GAMM|nr:nitrous oxide-stimulated promoter family protein [Thiorhodococcus drewsii]EGV31813.1 hypothetical protein ThidrDRAFT_1698 [Thiorhodococcus drewsii AZ1]